MNATLEKIHYVDEPEMDKGGSDNYFLTGNRAITLYNVEGDTAHRILTEFYCDLSADVEERIKEFLNENGMSDQMYELVRL